MTGIDTLRLRSGSEMPRIGLGTYDINGPDAPEIIASGLNEGYRLIDTAASYENEQEVGAAIRLSSIPRDDLFVVTKIRRSTDGGQSALRHVREASRRLGLNCIDLVLIHGPHASRTTALDTWRGLLRARTEGLVSHVGVSNFSPAQIEQLHDETGDWPEVSQVQLSPALQRRDDVEFYAKRGIVPMAWSPLGIAHGVLSNSVVLAIADEHAVTPAAIVLRWGIQRGHVVIPKASSAAHQRENLRVSQFALDREDMESLAALDIAEQSEWETRNRESW